MPPWTKEKFVLQLHADRVALRRDPSRGSAPEPSWGTSVPLPFVPTLLPNHGCATSCITKFFLNILSYYWGDYVWGRGILFWILGPTAAVCLKLEVSSGIAITECISPLFPDSFFPKIEKILVFMTERQYVGCRSFCFATVIFLYWETGPQAPPTLFFLLLFLGLLLSDFQCTKAFSFHNRSSLNCECRSVTILSTIAPCRIFNLSPN